MHRSLVVSVLLHVAVIAGWPAVSIPALSGGAAVASGHLQVVSLGALTPPPAQPRLLPLPGDEDDEDEEDEDGAGGEAEEPAPRDLEDGAARVGADGGENEMSGLQRVASVRARLADPAAAPEEPEEAAPSDSASADDDPSDGEDSEGLRIRHGTDELDYERLTDEEVLRLEELSALRPELVLFSPSSWLVVRNPDEVGSFLRARFDEADADTEVGGSLSVSLWVDERGSVEWAEINRSSGDGSIDASALELFRDVVAFRPARDGGMHTPVAAIFWLTW